MLKGRVSLDGAVPAVVVGDKKPLVRDELTGTAAAKKHNSILH